MKRSWNGLLALGRSMAGLEGRARAYRVVDGGVPRFQESIPAQRKAMPPTAVDAPAPVAAPAVAPVLASTSAPAPAPAAPAPAAIPRTAPLPAAVSSVRGTAGRLPAPPARPVVTRSPAWRWFGWFRQRPVGHGKVEQIELRLEDVRPVRSSLEAEDFVVVNTPTTRPSMARRNPFEDALPEAATPEPVPVAVPEVADAGRLNRLARWFRNREKTALK